MILTIDPGKKSGWAIFDNYTLVACGRDVVPEEWVNGVTEAVIEHPVIYPHGKTRDPNAIVKLAVNAGEQAGVLRANGISVRYVEPRAWKGTIPPDTCCRRVWGRLRPEERYSAKDFEPESEGEVKGGKDHVLDAIGIGLFVLGRLRSK